MYTTAGMYTNIINSPRKKKYNLLDIIMQLIGFIILLFFSYKSALTSTKHDPVHDVDRSDLIQYECRLGRVIQRKIQKKMLDKHEKRGNGLEGSHRWQQRSTPININSRIFSQ